MRWGRGDRWLVALHGFGDRARLFSVLEDALGDRYTVVAFDLPFHGQTEWRRDTFTRADILGILEHLQREMGWGRFSLMGFSFGARLALGVVPEALPHLDRLFLLAPDGIRTQGMRLAECVPMGLRRWLARRMEHPAFALHAVKWGERIGWVPPAVAQFLRFHLPKAERRRRMFGCWLALGDFSLPTRRIRALWERSALPVDIFIGAQDKVVSATSLYRLAQGLPRVRCFCLPTGHRVVGTSLAEKMRTLDF